MIIDCDTCRMQSSNACDQCIVPVLLHQMAGPFELAADERNALNNLSNAGMVAPLRLVRERDASDDGAGHGEDMGDSSSGGSSIAAG